MSEQRQIRNFTREEFEEEFRQVNASARFENAAIEDEAGKELIYRRLKGEITQEEFIKAIDEMS